MLTGKELSDRCKEVFNKRSDKSTERSADRDTNSGINNSLAVEKRREIFSV